jgi:hypothetical protein
MRIQYFLFLFLNGSLYFQGIGDVTGENAFKTQHIEFIKMLNCIKCCFHDNVNCYISPILWEGKLCPGMAILYRARAILIFRLQDTQLVEVVFATHLF